MKRSVVDYNKELPSIAHRRPWEKPSSHLIKDSEASSGWRENTSGRRPSSLLLVPGIRRQVDAWRMEGYPGSSDVTKTLFKYWFEHDRVVPGFDGLFRYHFCQREAIETLAWLVEIAKQRDVKTLIETYCTASDLGTLFTAINFQTTMDGKRQICRYVPELHTEKQQNLPPENLRRVAFKMATGSGKTWVMAMVIIWSHFHKQLVPESPMSSNFLIVAPNVIVYQRLEKDFSGNKIFHNLPLIPLEWKSDFSQKVILRGEISEPGETGGNLFVTNIHQLYEAPTEEAGSKNPVEVLLGKKPQKDGLFFNQRSMLEHIKSLDDLVVINDEAHHVHDEKLVWSKSLLAIHHSLQHGISAWLDFSATPKDQHGMYFPWTVCDYPLAQAVEDRIVKSPIIVDMKNDPEHPMQEPDNITNENVVEKYSYWLHAAVKRWKELNRIYTELKLGIRPVLFVMAEKNSHADALGIHFRQSENYGFQDSEILVIHTDRTGDVRVGDLERARKAARDIDKAESKIKVIVSVMMLREGWDVKNVVVVLGLRPFSAQAEILPEQVVGRGLRLMEQIGPDRTQTLEVLGTDKLLDVLRTQLEAEGVGVIVEGSEPISPVVIAPVQEKLQYDINIPLTSSNLTHNFLSLSDFNIEQLDSILKSKNIDNPFCIEINLNYAHTDTEVHTDKIYLDSISHSGNILAGITRKVMKETRLPSSFAKLYPIVQSYVIDRCFGRKIDLDNEIIQSHLQRLDLQDCISKYLARKIADLTVVPKTIQFTNRDYHLSETNRFSWRRNLPLFAAEKTVFNYVATYNDFEKDFARFLDQKAPDVVRFAALGTTEQGQSGAQFRINYLKPSGAIGLYYPDWVVVQKIASGEINWIIETKGRVWEDTPAKDAAMKNWCVQVSANTGTIWRYKRIDQKNFNSKIKTAKGLKSFVDIPSR